MKWLVVAFFLSLKFNLINVSKTDQTGMLFIEITNGTPEPITQTGAKVISWELY